MAATPEGRSVPERRGRRRGGDARGRRVPGRHGRNRGGDARGRRVPGRRRRPDRPPSTRRQRGRGTCRDTPGRRHGPMDRVRREPGREQPGDLVLEVEEVGDLAVDPRAELDRAGRDVHDPGGDANDVSHPLQGAVDHPRDAVAAIGVEDGGGVERSARRAAVAETLRVGRGGLHHLQPRVLQIDGDGLGDARAYPVVGRLPAHVRERRHDHRGRYLSCRGRHCGGEPRRDGNDPGEQADSQTGPGGRGPRRAAPVSTSRCPRNPVAHAAFNPEAAARGSPLFRTNPVEACSAPGASALVYRQSAARANVTASRGRIRPPPRGRRRPASGRAPSRRRRPPDAGAVGPWLTRDGAERGRGIRRAVHPASGAGSRGLRGATGSTRRPVPASAASRARTRLHAGVPVESPVGVDAAGAAAEAGHGVHGLDGLQELQVLVAALALDAQP